MLGNELMTGWINSGQSNPLSRITIASLADLGYQVNLSAADTYTASTTTSYRRTQPFVTDNIPSVLGCFVYRFHLHAAVRHRPGDDLLQPGHPLAN